MKLIIFFITTICAVSCYSQTTGVMHDPYQMAQIKGGYDSLMDNIENQLVIPECTKGKVYIQVKIDQNGIITQKNLIKGFCSKADSVASVILKTIEFIPAKKNGVPYTSFLIIPFTFNQ